MSLNKPDVLPGPVSTPSLEFGGFEPYAGSGQGAAVGLYGAAKTAAARIDDGWEEVSSKHDLVKGETYRLTLWLRLPDTIDIRDKIRRGVLAVDRFYDNLPAGVRNTLGGLDITKVETGLAASNNVSGRISPWPLRITFRKVSGGTPFIVIAGAIAALLIIIVGAVVITTSYFERLAENVLPEILNPGLILAGVVGIALIMRGRR